MPRNDTISVIVHDIDVSGPFTASSIGVARAFASERARIVLQDADSPHSLARLCTCRVPAISPSPEPTPPTDEQPADNFEQPDSSTEEGYSTIARGMLEKLQDPHGVLRDYAQYEEDMDREEEEVEKMIVVSGDD